MLISCVSRGTHFNLVFWTKDVTPYWSGYYSPLKHKYVGVGPELWEYMSRIGGFTYNITVVPLSEANSTQQWIDTNLGINSPFQFTSTAWSITPARQREHHFTMPLMTYGWSMVVKKSGVAKESVFDHLATFLMPFSTGVWFSILVAVAVSGSLMFFFERNTGGEDVSGDRKRMGHGLSLSIWMSGVEFTGAGGHTPRSMEGRIFQLIYTFSVVVVIAVYTANLAAFFTTKSYAPVRNPWMWHEQHTCEYCC